MYPPIPFDFARCDIVCCQCYRQMRDDLSQSQKLDILDVIRYDPKDFIKAFSYGVVSVDLPVVCRDGEDHIL